MSASVAYVYGAGADIAKADADLLSRNSTTITHRPGFEAGEQPVPGTSRARSFNCFRFSTRRA